MDGRVGVAILVTWLWISPNIITLIAIQVRHGKNELPIAFLLLYKITRSTLTKQILFFRLRTSSCFVMAQAKLRWCWMHVVGSPTTE